MKLLWLARRRKHLCCDVVINRSMRSPVQRAAVRRSGEVGLVLSTTRNCSGGFAEVSGCAPTATSSLAEVHDQPGQHAAASRPGDVICPEDDA